MSLIRYFLEKPALVAVIIVVLIIAGLASLFHIPIQLTPDVESPKLTVQTIWLGASPKEIEKEIVVKQEDALRNLPGLEKLSSESTPGRGRILLEFSLTTELDNAILHVSNELDQVTGYPENAKRPRIITSGSNASPFMWLRLQPTEGNDVPISQFLKYAQDEIVTEFEKIPGISEGRIYGGREKEIKVRFDSEKLAYYHISLPELIRTIRQENVNMSAGSINEGKREYVVRTISKIVDIEDLGDLIIKNLDGQRVYLKDVATVETGFKPPFSSVLYNDTHAVIMPLYKEHGANVLEISEKALALVEKLNMNKLAAQNLKLRRVSDQLYYINSAISLVTNNLFLGSFLAFLVLLVFLGNFRSSLVVLLSIPISIIGTFFCFQVFGRNINVVSLAGLAFSVGMVVDSAIVVLENIDQYRLKGAGLFDAALQATHEVWGAIFASTLTTVAVFLPILFVKEKAGQLFADISIAICSSIILALIVAVTVIPSLYCWLLGDRKVKTSKERASSKSPYNKLRRFFAALVDTCLKWLAWLLKSWQRKVTFIILTLIFSAACVFYLSPKMEYLPEGNRNLIFGILIPPSGYNSDEVERIGQFLMKELEPAVKGEIPNIPEINRIFYIGFGTRLIMGIAAEDPERVRELKPVIKQALAKVPGMYAITTQSSLFERGLSAGRSIDVELYADQLESIAPIGAKLFAEIRSILPGSQVRPIPGLEIGTPEVQIILDAERAAKVGLSTQELGLIVDVYTDGRKIDEYTKQNGEILDITLESKDTRVNSIAEFASLSIYTPTNDRIPIATVAQIRETVGPNQINRISQERVITLRVTPPEDLSIEESLNILKEKIITPALKKYSDTSGFRIELSGTADDFTKTRLALQGGFLTALGLTFLLLVVLFEDFLSPLVIMGSLPIAVAGGMIFLALTNLLIAPQALDVIVMLGFLMLVGIVVNNPILIVHRTLYLIRKQKMLFLDAILESVRSRVRPIFMSTMTSVLGLMPLVIVPGPGSELYRGLGSAVLGGLLLSTFVSIFFVPALFSLTEDLKKIVRIK